jgi:hypothetical protein
MHDRDVQRLLTEIGRLGLKLARSDTIGETWKTYALGYEVFCEATYDGDDAGVLNAGTEIARARTKLQTLGQYDA